MNIKEIAENLMLSSDGIWISKDKRTKISYPKEGNELFDNVEDNSFWFNHRNNIIIETIKRYPLENSIIFDFGAGNGCVSSSLKKYGLTVVALEPGIYGIKNLKKRGIDIIINSSIEDAGFKKKKIPAIGLFDVLEHIENDINFLMYLKEILEHNGRLYITVPAYKFLWSIEDEYAGHFRRYSLNNLKDLVRSCGFTIEFCSYFFSFLPIPIFFLRTLPSKLGLIRKFNIKKTQNHYICKNTLFNRLLNFILKKELNSLRTGRKLIGSSCIIVARNN